MLLSYYKTNTIEAGCDEAGRGCLAGPVVAAAVILPENYTHPLLNDSKKLTEKQRYNLREEIEKVAIDFAVGIIDNHTIDEINILKASIKAMHQALGLLRTTPEHIIIDGNRFYKYKNIPHQCIVKGDSKFLSIAAASILAKTCRDDLMTELNKIHPEYNWGKNKGYPTKEHRRAIKEFGTTPYHRMTFRLLDEQLSLDF
ncbi:MAG: ribonuclease HII [Bacteroidetes bacterium GWC2_33_15]|nr:MAG: ribonuclease HII [Bacteroidetes bacterium GWA2_33_15]OFX49407.1 MAG: ribonuclease HII [Bacteroidetes bacterium GWC2_33_15]OFX63000.1 MAG: ribonuclease HII [Bacteroidetes bacterium GWB2_32_14]OFX68755.1 MAG: ribonuclease HII [Bacteroidetes bacterium GWD2_33_33]HAN19070.1 ribonuclease HII [Bacteroidales bacterium]